MSWRIHKKYYSRGQRYEYFYFQGDINVIASFDRRGDHVYTGNAKGKILILDPQTLTVKASFKITVGTSSTTGIKSIEFARRGE